MLRDAALPSLDRRTKRYADVRPISVDELVDEVGPAIAERNRELAARAQSRLRLPPLSLTVGQDTCTADDGQFRLGSTADPVLVVLDHAALTDLVAGVRSTNALALMGGGELPKGGLAEFLAWEHVLRALSDGRPLYEPGTITFRAADETPLDLTRKFTPDDDECEFAQLLAEAGFLHLRAWIDPTLLPAIDSEVAVAAHSTRPDEPHRWWATMGDGSKRRVRVMYVLRVSPTMAGLVQRDAYMRLEELFHDGHRCAPEEPQSSEALIKPVGVASGLTDFPWHRDSAFGEHDYRCAGYAVGLPLTPSGEEAGHLRVVAGSHWVSVPAPDAVRGYDVDLPVINVMTEPGDLTVHVGCTLHGTRPPRSVERTVVYTTFGLSPLAGDDKPTTRDGARPDLARIDAARQ